MFATLCGHRVCLPCLLNKPQVKDVDVLSALRQVRQQEGLISLWKGNLITIIHRVPYSAINFSTYEVAKEQYRRYPLSDHARRILSGATAGFVACIVVSRDTRGLNCSAMVGWHGKAVEVLLLHVAQHGMHSEPTMHTTSICFAAQRAALPSYSHAAPTCPPSANW